MAVMVLAAREKDKDKPEYKKIAEIFHSGSRKEIHRGKIQGNHRSGEVREGGCERNHGPLFRGRQGRIQSIFFKKIF